MRRLEVAGDHRPAGRELNGQPITPVIDNQVELEASEPSQAALASRGRLVKDPMGTDALGAADRRGRGQ